MKSIEKLEKSYKREMELAEKHRQNAADIKKEMELLKGSMINQKTKALNFNGAEYDQFMKLLASDKQNILEAIKLVLGKESLEALPESAQQDINIMPADENEKGDDSNGENEDVYGIMER